MAPLVAEYDKHMNDMSEQIRLYQVPFKKLLSCHHELNEAFNELLTLVV